MNLKDRIPWQIKLIAKVILSRLPVNISFWRRLSLFSHGSMNHPEYAYGVFKKHFDRVGFSRKDNFVALELGPGDSLFSALIAHAFGAAETCLVDAGFFAVRDLRSYRLMAEFLAEKGLPTLDVSMFGTLEGLLEACSGHYFTSGLSSLKAIPDSSVDFIWSNAVLEHVRKHEFVPMMCELRRIIAKNGVCSHTIDLRDHFGYALNNLRFSNVVWESELMVRSGIYTNRIRYSEMLNIFKQAGFDAQVVNKQCWSTLPTPVNKFNKEFRRLPEEELKIWEFDVVLHPSAPF